MLIWKEVIPPGTHFYWDKKAKKARALDVTPARVQHYHDQGKRMLEAGLSIPVPLEHQPDAMPMTAEEKAAADLRHMAGEVKDWRIDGGRLQAQLDITDPDIARKIPKTIRWTSPFVHSFTDGKNRRWDDVIGHVALTARPRITDVAPFPDVATAMTSLHFSAVPPPEDGMCLSRAGLMVKGHAGKYRPVYPMAFSLLTGVPLAIEEMVAVEEKSKGLPKKKGPPKPGTEGRDPPADVELDDDADMTVEEALLDTDGDVPMCTVLCDLLAANDIDLGEGTTEENLQTRLYKALMDKVRQKGSAPEKNPLVPGNKPPPPKPGGPAPPKSPAPVTQEQPPMFMSIEEVEAIPDAQLKAVAKDAYHQRKRNEALEKNAIAVKKAEREARLARLNKRLGEASRAKLAKMAEGASFSLGEDGVVVDSLEPALEVLEASLLDLPDLLKGQKAQEQAHPRDAGDGPSPERVKAVQAEVFKNAGVKVSA